MPKKTISSGNVIPFDGHIRNAVAKLDELYEFGPSYVLADRLIPEFAMSEYIRVLSSLSPQRIRLGLKRCSLLGSWRTRVAPTPRYFEEICMASSEDWLTLKFKFHRKDRKKHA